jgi:hypothetical protein
MLSFQRLIQPARCFGSKRYSRILREVLVLPRPVKIGTSERFSSSGHYTKLLNSTGRVGEQCGLEEFTLRGGANRKTTERGNLYPRKRNTQRAGVS